MKLGEKEGLPERIRATHVHRTKGIAGPWCCTGNYAQLWKWIRSLENGA